METTKNEIGKREEVTYTPSCHNCSSNHHRKYRCYSKIVSSVDSSKTGLSAITFGEYLKVTKEHLVVEGSVILEKCDECYTIYKIEKSESIFVADFYSRNFPTMIQKLAELTN